MQWFQLYEIDASLLASVMQALGDAFPHYAVYAPSEHDVLILASMSPLPRLAEAAVFDQPLLAQELRSVHVLAPGDLDARYLGSRATLEPLFASYGMPANSDYYPVLDLNAARHRFMDMTATDVVALLNAGVPVLEMLEPGLRRRPVNPQHRGAYNFERVENTRLARYARDFLMHPTVPRPESIPTLLQKDLELIELRLIECREPAERDIWLHSLVNAARTINPYLPPQEADAVWAHIAGSRCYGSLHDFQRRWLALFRAVATRDAAAMGALAEALIATQQDLSPENRAYLLMAAMAGLVASGAPVRAITLWNHYSPRLPWSLAGQPVFRLLRCHAGRGDQAGCVKAFAAYAD